MDYITATWKEGLVNCCTQFCPRSPECWGTNQIRGWLEINETIPFLDDLEKALKLGEVKVAYGRVMFLGEAGVGKSTLLGALMNQPVAAEATSTVMADTKVVKCQWKRFDTKEDSFWCNLTEEDEVEELAILAKQVMNIGSHSLLKDLKAAIAVKIFNPGDLPLPNVQNTVGNTTFKDEAIKVLSDITAACRSLVDTSLQPTADQYLNVWDCGGQRVFLDVLPAFLTSRTIFLLMFDASKDLQDKVAVTWNQGGISTPLETLNLSSEDLMIQWMSCINASLSNKAAKFYKAQHSQYGVTIPPFPSIVAIGTHGDMIDAQKKKDVTLKLKSNCLGKPYSDQVADILILDSTKRGNEEDPAIVTLKRIVRDFVSQALCIPTPIAWVLFRKLLTKLTKSRPIVALDSVAVISRACCIADTTLLSVLTFYHELGAFLHYADIDKLKDKVIAQPEWLVKHLGTILAPKESGRSSKGPTEAWRLLRENGILVEALYQEVWKTSTAECEVHPQAFADLLEHCCLIAEITQESSFIPRNYGKVYFMPCVLPTCASDAMATPPDAVLTAAPLHLTFSSKYVPPGFFVRLATILCKSPRCSISFIPPMYSNRITFQYGDDGPNGRIDDITISGTNLSIRVDVVRRSHCLHVDKYNFPSTCRSILKLLLRAAHDLYQWFPSIGVTPGFQCECCRGPSPHFAVVPTEAESLTPLRCRVGSILTPTAEQQLWLKIPAIPAAMDKEGVLYESEILGLLTEVNEQDFTQLSKALEMEKSSTNDSEDKMLNLCIWSRIMGDLARSHLVYHLNRIGLSKCAKRIGAGFFPKITKQHSGQDKAHMYSVVTDKELVGCSVHISGDADLSILAAHLGYVENTTNPPRDALSMLRRWKQQHISRAYKQTLIDTFTNLGQGFEKASRILNGDGPEIPDMRTLQDSIGEKCAPVWYDLGLHLDIPDSALKVIEINCPDDCKKRMRMMLQKWMEICTHPTWRVVVTALRTIRQNQLANEIEKKYCLV